MIFADSTYRFTLELLSDKAKFLAIDKDGCYLHKTELSPILQIISKPTNNSYYLTQVGTNFTAIVNVVEHFNNLNDSVLNCLQGKDGTTKNQAYHYTAVSI